MAATVNVEEGNGSGPTWTVITSGRYCTTDSYNPGSNYPCVVPTSGNNYSYWKHHRIAWTGIGTQISNIRWYTPGNVASTWQLGTGGQLMVGLRDSGDHGCPTANYQQATGTQGTTGHYIKDATNGHAYYNSQAATPGNADNYTSASPLTVDTTVYTDNGASKSVVTQVNLATDATQGDKSNITFTFLYDEI